MSGKPLAASNDGPTVPIQGCREAHGRALFDTELLVVAATPDDAEDEAISCIDSFESISDWSLTPDGSVPADEGDTRMYHERGPFAVFDPADLHERG